MIPRATSTALSTTRSLALMAALALACSAGLAEKPEWAGGGKGDKHEQKHEQKHGGKHGDQMRHDGNAQRPGQQVRVGGYFGEPQRVVVNNYYGNEHRAGRCPPGLAKKNNGCMPPGQAKKYHVGQRLPDNVVYYEVPQRVVYQLGAPPSGHRYVRVASDILLLAVGTGMVVDAIQGLSGY
jgi:Ni/Co efflux regulator RcnB